MESVDTTNKLDDKTCKVCGDKALGYNFSVITCESCKAFFRRNAIKKKDHKCPFDNQCKINVVTRRFCQKCRLDRCFDVGMKKEWIMTDEQKQLKKEKLSGNKNKRKSEDICSVTKFANLGDTTNEDVGQHIDTQSNCIQFESDPGFKPQARVLAMPQENVATRETSSNTDESTIKVNDVQTQAYNNMTENYEEQLTVKVNPVQTQTCNDATLENSPSAEHNFCGDKVMFGEINGDLSEVSRMASTKQSNNFLSEELRKNFPNSEIARREHATSNGCRDNPSNNKHVVDRSWIHNTVAGIVNVAISAEYSNLASQTGLQVVGSRTLSSIEIEKLNELVIANTVLKLPGEDDEYFYNRDTNPCLLDVINMTDNAIRKIIKMSKKITAFKNLCQEDQIALLKGSCTELMILRSVMTYDSEKDSWQGPKMTYIKVDVLKEAKGNIYEEHKRFIHSFDPKWRNDENLMLILSAIVLFTPTRPNIVHAEVIEMEQGSYYFLLQRYLESIYIGCEAKANFLKLVRTVQDLQKLNENHVRVFLDVNPKDVEPLLIEIFDLIH